MTEEQRVQVRLEAVKFAVGFGQQRGGYTNAQQLLDVAADIEDFIINGEETDGN